MKADHMKCTNLHWPPQGLLFKCIVEALEFLPGVAGLAVVEYHEIVDEFLTGHLSGDALQGGWVVKLVV